MVFTISDSTNPIAWADAPVQTSILEIAQAKIKNIVQGRDIKDEADMTT